MGNAYHAGLGYTREQQHELDELFTTYIRSDQYADAAGYENDLLNTAAEEAYQEYEERMAHFDALKKLGLVVACVKFAIDSGEWFDNWNLEASEVF